MSALTLPDDLRAITVLQPWASLIAYRVKTIETRSRLTKYRGPVLIHAGLAESWAQGQRFGSWRCYRSHGRTPNARVASPAVAYDRSGLVDRKIELPLGAIVAVAHIVDCIPVQNVIREDSADGWEPWGKGHVIAPLAEIHLGDYTLDRWALLLAGVTRLAEPVPAKGNQAVPWRVPADVAAQVREQVEAVTS